MRVVLNNEKIYLHPLYNLEEGTTCLPTTDEVDALRYAHAGQLFPRVLRNFMRERGSSVPLGISRDLDPVRIRGRCLSVRRTLTRQRMSQRLREPP